MLGKNVEFTTLILLIKEEIHFTLDITSFIAYKKACSGCIIKLVMRDLYGNTNATHHTHYLI